MPLRNPWAVLALLTAAQGGMSMGAYLWGPLAPFLVQSFGLTTTAVGLLNTAFYAVAAFVAVPAGMVVDRSGGRTALVGCQLIMVVALVAVALAPQFAAVLAAAALAGLGNGFINQAGARGAVLWFPAHRRGLAMGLRQMGNMLGGATSAALVPLLAIAWGWRVGPAAIALIVAAIALLTLRWYADPDPSPGAPAAAGGSRRAALAGLLRDPAIVALLVLSPLLGYGQIALTSFYPLYLTTQLGFDPADAGRCLTVAMLAAALGRVLWGWVGDRFFRTRRSLCLAVVLGIATLAALALPLLPQGTSVTAAAALAAVFGATALGWHALLLVVLAELAGAATVGAAFGLFINVAWAGWVVGPLVFGALVDGPGWEWAWGSVVLCSLTSTAVLAALAVRAARPRTPG